MRLGIFDLSQEKRVFDIELEYNIFVFSLGPTYTTEN